MTYTNFSVRIDPESDGSFGVLANVGPSESKRQQFRVPDEVSEFMRLTRHAGEADGMRSLRPARRGEGMARDTKRVGRALFEALIRDQIQFLYARLTAREDTEKLRLRISVGSTSAALTSIAAIPWELLVSEHENDLPLALSSRHSVVRCMSLPMSTTPLAVPRPLRIALMYANPVGSARLAADRERDIITKRWLGALDTDIVEIPPTREALRQCLASRPVHVLHYMGHGDFSEQQAEGALLLEREDGTPDLVYGEALGSILRGSSVQLAFLNACETGTSAVTATHDAFGGVAAALMAARIPAVIANQFPISDTAAIEFADEFYTRLVSGVSVEDAVVAGRQRLHKANSIEWATPVLYMEEETGNVLSLQPRAALAPASGRGEAVFLAAVSPALLPVRDGLAAALRDAGLTVVEALAESTWDASRHDDAVRQQLEQSVLSIHLLDGDCGAALSPARPLIRHVPDTLPMRQLILGTYHARSQLVLYEGGMDSATIRDRGYAAYYDTLVRRTRDPQRFEMRSEDRSQMKAAILMRLGEIGTRAAPGQSAGEGSPVLDSAINRVYIDVHSSDVDAAVPLFRTLQNAGISVVLGGAVSSGTPTSRLAAAEQCVAESDLVVLVLGGVKPEWAEQRFTWLDGVLRRKRLRTQLAIVLTRRWTDEQLSFNMRPTYPVYDGTGGMTGALLGQLLGVHA